MACCSWERTPAAEVLPGTAQVWIDALCFNRSWDENRDTSRIRAAFVTLTQTRRVWPAPADFLASLPDSTQLRLPGAGEKPADPPELRAWLEQNRITPENARRMLDGYAATASARLPREESDTTPEQRAAIEQQLRAHYADRKSAAAGDTGADA